VPLANIFSGQSSIYRVIRYDTSRALFLIPSAPH
jgi:hypothetical protein